MQIKTLHKNMYRFYAWARTQECFDAYRKEIEESVRHWESLPAEGVSTINCAKFTGMSRAAYYRHRARLTALAKGTLRPQRHLRNATNRVGVSVKSRRFWRCAARIKPMERPRSP